METREPVCFNSTIGRQGRRDRRTIVLHTRSLSLSVPQSPGLWKDKMDGYGYGQLSWHFTRAPLTFPCSNVMHITYRSTPDHCLSEDKYFTSVLFMFTQIWNMGINDRFMANLCYDKFLELCKYMCFEI